MADISIVKIKVRRGTDSDRRRVILDEGELGFTTDTQRFFVGDGGTLGGINIANKFIGTGLRTNYGDSLLGDFVYDTSENALFALILSCFVLLRCFLCFLFLMCSILSCFKCDLNVFV